MSDGKTVLRSRHDAACGEDPDACRFAEEWRFAYKHFSVIVTYLVTNDYLVVSLEKKNNHLQTTIFRVKPENSLFGDKVNLAWKEARILKDEKFCTCRKNGKSSQVTCDYQKEIFNPESRAEQEDGVDKTVDIVLSGMKSMRRRKRGLDDNEFDDYFDSHFLYNESFHGQVSNFKQNDVYALN